jgi:hypothetical protein
LISAALSCVAVDFTSTKTEIFQTGRKPTICFV